MRVFSEQLDFFRTQGYLVLPDVVSSDSVARLAESVVSALVGEIPVRSKVTTEYLGRQATQVQQLWRGSEEVRRFMRESSIAAIAAHLMQTPEVRLWHDQSIFKPRLHGGVVNFHQDYFYWQNTYPADSISAWIALSDVRVACGCVWIVPGSHRWGLLAGTKLGIDKTFSPDPEQIFQQCTVAQRAAKRIPVPLKPGDALFHHCLLMHGSYENRSSSDRLCYIQHLLPAHARYQPYSGGSNEAELKELQLEQGDSFPPSHFPILWPIASVS